MKYKYIFGPVPSRRLGFSLGIDLVPYKTCNFNCIYCECGKTTCLTNERKEFFPVKEIIKELDSYLKNSDYKIDYITFSGAGEPLLYSKICEIIYFLKSKYSQYKLALLTNGALFYKSEIIKEVEKLDLIIPSLDAVTENIFKKINRPHKDLSIEKIISGLIELRKKYLKKIYLEIFFVKGLNDSDDEVFKLKKVVEKINPDKIQLNTIDRPPAEVSIEPVSKKRITEIRNFFGKNAEIVSSKITHKKSINSYNESTIINCLQKRPLTLEDLISVTGLHVNEINKILRKLENRGKIEKIKGERGIFYALR